MISVLTHRSRVWVLACLFLGFTLMIEAQESWNLKRFIEMARENNPELLSLKLETNRAEINLKAAVNNYYPNLEAQLKSGNNYGLLIDPITNELFFGNTFINSFQINSTFNLFRGFYNRYQKALANEQMNTASYIFNKRFNEITLELTYYYFQAWYASENAELQKKNLENFQKRKKFIDGSIQNEVMHKRNIYNVDYLIARAEAAIIANENTMRKNKAILFKLAGINWQDSVKMNFSDARVSETRMFDYNTVIEQARKNFPDIKAGQSQIINAEYAFRIARSARYPKLLVEGQLGTKTSTNKINEPFNTQLGNNQNQYIGLSLNIPIFRNYSLKQAEEIAALDIEAAKNDAKSLLLELENNVFQAVMDYNNALKLYQTNIRLNEAAQQEYDFAVRLFDVGNMGLFEFTEIAQRYIKASEDLLEAKFNCMLKLKIIEFYTDYGK
ncbi:MAG: Outer membrane efflux protein [Bacteroidetes bacterium ADurb.Bin408]|nr:MAG: Outer membrane efflux protein [Bacteroidetes bacterium ADurb.Bin408]